MPCRNPKGINWLDKARFIAHYAVDGCSTTLKVYVETGVRADTNLVMGIVNTSPKDFVRFLLRPKGARTDRHGIRSMKRNTAAEEDELIPDTAKLAADTIHEVTGWHVPTWGALGDALFEIARPFIRGAYYLLIANVVEDFAFDWYSGILLSPDSKCDIGRFGLIGSRPAIISFPFQNFRPNVPIFPPRGTAGGPFGQDLFEGAWCVILTVEIEQDRFHPAACNAAFRLMVGTNDKQACGHTEQVELAITDNDAKHKFVRTVTAPETLSVDMSFHISDGGGGQYQLTMLLEGFRI